MRFYTCGLFVILFSATLARAEGVPFVPAPADLRYANQNPGTLSALQVHEIATLARALGAARWQELSAQAGSGDGVFGVDQIFWNPSEGGAVFLKLGVDPGAEHRNKFLTDNVSYLYHGLTPSGLGYAVYFMGVTPERASESIEQIQNAWRQDKVSRRSPSLLSRLVPVAHAGDSPSTHLKGFASAEISAPNQNESQSLAQNVLTCSRGVGRGVYDSTVGLAQRAGQGAIKVVKASAQTIAAPLKAWQGVVGKFKSFVGMLGQAFGLLKYDAGIGRTDDKLYGINRALEPEQKSSAAKAPVKTPSKYAQMSAPQKLNFVCGLVTKVGIAGATWFFAPANGAALAPEVATFLNTGAQLATMETARTLFMEVEYADVAKKLGERHRQMSEDQRQLSEQWARENPREAEEIRAHYRKEMS